MPAERGDAASRDAQNTLVRCGYSRPGGCSSLLETLQEAITTLIGDYGYVAIFVLMVLESACIPIPSEVTMLFGGALASPGFAAPGHELDLVIVALIGTLGNLVGSWLAYGIGAAGGRPLVDRFGRYLLILPHEVDRAHEWFERRGELTVFVSRLLPVIRTFISLPAGVARMPFWRFTIYTVLGCLPWTFALAWLGYLLGENWAKVEEFLQPVAWAIACAAGDRSGLVRGASLQAGAGRLRRARRRLRRRRGGVGSRRARLLQLRDDRTPTTPASARTADHRSPTKRRRPGKSGRSSRSCSPTWWASPAGASSSIPKTSAPRSLPTSRACGRSWNAEAARWRSSSGTR